MIGAALDAARRGWRVFPLMPGRKRPRPQLAAWEQRATCDPERLRRWWATHPHDNVGVACGPSGLVVVDVDYPKPGQAPPEAFAGARHGLDVLDQLARRHAHPVECTWTVATPSGGRHLYYRTPTGAQLRNTTHRLGWCIDTSAAGGYVVAAGSSVDGRRYRVVDHSPPAELPDWITQLLAPPPLDPAPHTPPGRVDRGRYIEVAVAGEVERVLTAGPGARNHALNKAAWQLARLIAARQLDPGHVEDALLHAAVTAGYADGPLAARAVIRSAINARLRRL